MSRYLVLCFAAVLCASCGPAANDADTTAANDADTTAADDDDSTVTDDDDSTVADDDDSTVTDDDDSTATDDDDSSVADDDDSSVADDDDSTPTDADGDGFAADVDCDDSSASIYPGADEICDGFDNDCDAVPDNGAAVGSAVLCPGADCAAILAARPGLTGQGTYFINPLPSSSTAFGARCDFDTEAGGWTVVDLSAAAEWQGGFTSWAQWSADTAGPDIAPSPAYESWRGWFGHVAGPSTEFRRSTDCQIVDGTGVDEIWRMTGNYFGCTWYNTNCPMATDGTCSECNDPINQWIWGTCSHMVGSPDAVYAYACYHWWNSAPALGTNGAWCVAYRTP